MFYKKEIVMKIVNLNKYLLSFFVVCSYSAYAQDLEITASIPFPATVSATTVTWATYTITNVSDITITPVDLSIFPPSSGITEINSTCNPPVTLAPGASCEIELQQEAFCIT